MREEARLARLRGFVRGRGIAHSTRLELDKEPMMPAAKKKAPSRLPRSVRKHVRQRKSVLRRTLGEAEAKKAIDHLMRSVRSGGGAPVA